jgi:phosphoadenosine phosphosulfate reductase
MSVVNDIKELIAGLSPGEVLQKLVARFPGKITFSTSLGWEDQVLTHMIHCLQLPIRIFTLDTGRMFSETYKVLNRTREKYNLSIETFFPETAQVEQLMNEKGPFSFYDSVDNRKECCRIRKVVPLRRALKGFDCWITGIRAEQSDNRLDMPNVEWDEGNQILKVHPILHWTLDEVKAYIKQNEVPYNALHDQGFVSIGCAPCTRAIREGENFRDGRWWWEDTSKKECGLHHS